MEQKQDVQSQDMPAPGLEASASDASAQQGKAQAEERRESAGGSSTAATAGPGPGSCRSSGAGAGGFAPQDFSCARCGLLLFEPVVLSCGHAVCSATCRPGRASAAGAPQGAGASAALDATGSGGGAAAAAPGPGRPAASSTSGCPSCGMHVALGAKPCVQLQQLLQQLFPQQMAQRGAEVAQQAGAASQPCQEAVEEPEAQAKRHLQEMLRQAMADRDEGGSPRQRWAEVIRVVEQNADEAYTW
jgi:hypothetical protein